VHGASSGLLAALEALVQARSAVPGTLLKSLSYHNNVIELKLTAPDAASLDKLSSVLRSSGWQAELQEGNHVGEGYEGRIKVRMGS
jgi:type II secretory pathway component PulL